MKPVQDIVGQTFNKLTVVKYVGPDTKNVGQHFWLCRCKCGNLTKARGTSLRNNQTKSCGCLLHVWQTKHGLYNTPIYKRWRGMKTRCDNPKHPAFHRYGGRGVKHEWPDFASFYRDMFQSFEEHVSKYGFNNTQLDRIDNNGDYTKQNCRWVTPKQNSRNQSANRLITYKGKTQCMAAWADEIGLSNNTLYHRLLKGWPVDKALSTPKMGV